MLVAMVLGLAALVEVDGATDCPSPAALTEALAQQAPADAKAPATRVRLSREAGELRVLLLGSAGQIVAERRLAATGTCAELADAAALVVVVWDRELDASRMATPLLPEPASPSVVHRRLARPARVDWDVAARFTVGWEPGASVGLGGAVDATVGPRAGRFAARLGARGAALQTSSFGPGTISWTRPALSIGARYQIAPARWRIDVHADALAALVIVRADGYSSGHQALDFDPGLGGGVRAGYLFGRLLAFVEADIAGWPRPQTARVAGIQPGFDLPRFELTVSAGFAVAP